MYAEGTREREAPPEPRDMGKKKPRVVFLGEAQTTK